LFIRSLRRNTCSGVNSFTSISETILTFAPFSSKKDAAAKSSVVVEGKRKLPVSSYIPSIITVASSGDNTIPFSFNMETRIDTVAPVFLMHSTSPLISSSVDG